MSFVDDSLMGTSPARSAKSGGMSAAQFALGAGEKSAAFESAIADAGKKKPMIALSGAKDGTAPDGKGVVKNETDDAPDQQSRVKNEKILATTEQGISAKTKEPATFLPLQNVALKEKAVSLSRDDKAASLALLNRLTSSKDTAATGAGSKTEVPTDVADVEAAPTISAGDRPVEPEIEFLPSLDKLVKSGNVDSRQSALKNDDHETPAATDSAETGGVSQLLALLGAPKELPATSAEVSTSSTELISEFQALADRAGKARNDTRQATGANGQRQAALAADANAVANATASGADQTFRFARADGKGQSVSMSINTDGDKSSARIDATGTKADAVANAKAETVTVLDSRRYLGIAANTNSQAVAAAVTGSTEWARAMQPSSGLSSPEAASAAGKVVNTLKIQMHPIDLGLVTATLRLKDDELHVDLKVESGEAFRQLSDDQNAMVKALRSQGFAVDQITITFNAPSDTSTSNSGSQQPQAQAGQQGRDASGDGAAQGRGRNNDSSQQQSGERWTGNGATDEVSAASESGRADHTYM